MELPLLVDHHTFESRGLRFVFGLGVMVLGGTLRLGFLVAQVPLFAQDGGLV